jgi:hypothetical protein
MVINHLGYYKDSWRLQTLNKGEAYEEYEWEESSHTTFRRTKRLQKLEKKRSYNLWVEKMFYSIETRAYHEKLQFSLEEMKDLLEAKDFAKNPHLLFKLRGNGNKRRRIVDAGNPFTIHVEKLTLPENHLDWPNLPGSRELHEKRVTYSLPRRSFVL